MASTVPMLVSSTHWLSYCSALVLQVRAVFMDDIMQQPDLPELDMVADYETRSLRCGPGTGCGFARVLPQQLQHE